MSTNGKKFFLTGGTGFLGHYLLRALLVDADVCCRVMMRPPTPASRDRLTRLLAELDVDLDALIANGRIELAEGNLPEGLPSGTLEGIDQVIHSAGFITFAEERNGEPARTNLEGTRSLLDAAAKAGVPRFNHISTAYVCGDISGIAPEKVTRTMPPLRNAYERSKWQAEQLVDDWGNQHGIATICRPSILMGDLDSGRATNAGGLYAVAKVTELLARAAKADPMTDPLQMELRIRGRSDATANIIPICWAADKMAAIALDPAQHGRVHHIINPQPPTHAEIRDWMEEFFGIGGAVFVDIDKPLDDPNRVEKIFQAIEQQMGDYFRHKLSFENGSGGAGPDGQRLVDRDQFISWLRYAQEHEWMR